MVNDLCMCFEIENSKDFKKEIGESRCRLLLSIEKANDELNDFIEWLKFKNKGNGSNNINKNRAGAP